MEQLLNYLMLHKMIIFVIIAIIFDTFIGVLWALKDKRVNSTIGIDGMIRKVGMLGCIVFLVIVDYLLKLNLVGWLPADVLEVFSVIGLDYVGISDLFGLLFVAFEILSIIKNWAMLGLPMFRGITDWVTTFLETFTDELPTTDKNIKE